MASKTSNSVENMAPGIVIPQAALGGLSVAPAHEWRTDRYQFQTVEDFFQDLDQWNRVERVVSWIYDKQAFALRLVLAADNGANTAAAVYFLRRDTLRIRFNPAMTQPEDLSEAHSRTVVRDTVSQLLRDQPAFAVTVHPYDDRVEFITQDDQDVPFLRVTLHLAPYGIELHRFDGVRNQPIIEDAFPAFRFRKVVVENGKDTDYSVVSARVKPASKAYVGFGEKGGASLCKNGRRLTYYGYDNMRYRQVYDVGPLDEREPLYDSNPVFFEYDASQDRDAIAATFVDNTGELLVDVGFANANEIRVGSLFGELDTYLFVGDRTESVMDAFTSIVGKPRLKPRHILGYQQGCYGYDTQDKVLAVAQAYRNARFPIDGLHIDVDIQNRYQTFTTDPQAFPDPGGMFGQLRRMGFKCSTNITPIISNLDPGYGTYQEGLARNAFVVDHRCLSHPDQTEWHHYYSGGQACFWSNWNGNINNGKPYIGEVYYGGDRGTTGHYPDFGNKAVRIWWGTQYQHLFDLGLEMVWQDMTSPCIRETRGDMKSLPYDLCITNDATCKFGDTPGDDYPQSPFIKVNSLYAYNLHKATYHGLNHLAGRENKRNFIIGRGAYTGAHRFAGLWTGDNASSWEFLKINVAQVLALGLSGQPVAGADIGGFEREQPWEQWVDPELFIRWMLAGSLLPWFRNHYIAKGVKAFQEPYRFQEVLDQVPAQDRWVYEAVLPVTRHYVERRYRLLPLLYDAMFAGTETGMPICRAMVINDGHDKALCGDRRAFLSDQFFVGKDLLVAPVLDRQRDTGGVRQVYLPDGSRWYGYMDNAVPLGPVVPGGTTLRYDAHISTDPGHLGFILPMFVREGAILPSQDLEQYVGETHDRGAMNPITLSLYPGSSGTYDLYLDDGISRSSTPTRLREMEIEPEARGEYRLVHIEHHSLEKARQRIVRLVRTHDQFSPKENFMILAVLHGPEERDGKDPSGSPLSSILVNGNAPRLLAPDDPARQREELRTTQGLAWYYDRSARISYLRLEDAPHLEVVLTYAP